MRLRACVEFLQVPQLPGKHTHTHSEPQRTSSFTVAVVRINHWYTELCNYLRDQEQRPLERCGGDPFILQL